LIEVGKMLGGGPSGDDEETDKKEKRLKEIYKILKLDEDQLKGCQHPTDITKTCRSIVKELYPDVHKRSTMLVSLMTTETLEAIHGMHFNNYVIRITYASADIGTILPYRYLGEILSLSLLIREILSYNSAIFHHSSVDVTKLIKE
jgi:hypothetical protein